MKFLWIFLSSFMAEGRIESGALDLSSLKKDELTYERQVLKGEIGTKNEQIDAGLGRLEGKKLRSEQLLKAQKKLDKVQKNMNKQDSKLIRGRGLGFADRLRVKRDNRRVKQALRRLNRVGEKTEQQGRQYVVSPDRQALNNRTVEAAKDMGRRALNMQTQVQETASKDGIRQRLKNKLSALSDTAAYDQQQQEKFDKEFSLSKLAEDKKRLYADYVFEGQKDVPSLSEDDKARIPDDYKVILKNAQDKNLARQKLYDADKAEESNNIKVAGVFGDNKIDKIKYKYIENKPITEKEEADLKKALSTDGFKDLGELKKYVESEKIQRNLLAERNELVDQVESRVDEDISAVGQFLHGGKPKKKVKEMLSDDQWLKLNKERKRRQQAAKHIKRQKKVTDLYDGLKDKKQGLGGRITQSLRQLGQDIKDVTITKEGDLGVALIHNANDKDKMQHIDDRLEVVKARRKVGRLTTLKDLLVTSEKTVDNKISKLSNKHSIKGMTKRAKKIRKLKLRKKIIQQRKKRKQAAKQAAK